MKKILYLAFSLLVLSSTTNLVQAKTAPKSELTEQQNLRMNQISQRVEEIKKLDKSTLSFQEQQNLKSELTAMKKEAKASGNGGIYLSVTALLVIIIIILLIK